MGESATGKIDTIPARATIFPQRNAFLVGCSRDGFDPREGGFFAEESSGQSANSLARPPPAP
jgi:hypothetical protein